MSEPTVEDSTTTPTGTRPFWLAIAIAVFVILADQLSKAWAIANLSDGQQIPVVGEFIRFILVYNPGAAFGLGTGYTWVLAIIAGAAAVAVGWYAWKVRSIAWTVALGMILGGAVTHLGDRLFRDPGFARGHVVDFIAYGNFFIGNVADIAIVGGVAFAVLLTLLKVRMRRDGVVETVEPAEPLEPAEPSGPSA